ncbi:ATP-binding protein [Pseudemcibacter aquimaris]|uniref:ATP-binding protein n=1 Tax=Pseudemcibacter aquimaris TaxID=2857064 RepID=UPI0020136C4A|nr:ATP-binding protein [Pseudemcibacter aquimaris]MCC3862504.1 CBS domain-containing protein [Pseudemcibacter aquimaris]WDU57766.1 CBS domain-containing protein [Pseudemcibacter aquimaris]
METVDLITEYIEPALETDCCAEIFERFRNDSDLLAIPVLDGDKPIGILKRMDFLVRLADRYGRPLYSKQPVSVLMDSNPVIVNSNTKVDEMNARFASESKHALQEGFIIVDNGEYKGIGSALTLLQANMHISERKMGELKKARQHAEEASKAKSDFLANMSHELRTPLNAVIGFSDLILQHMSKEVSSQAVLGYIGDIHSSGRHLLGLINSILDLSRIESGNFDLMESDEFPEDIVDEAIRIMAPKALSKNITIIKRPHNCVDYIRLDEQLIRQVVINLLSNAVKFSPEHTEIYVSIKQDERGAFTIDVEDQGPGIPINKMDDILKPFSQLDGAFVRNHEGTGLGLPLVKSYVEAHNGKFNLYNAVPTGTIAKIYFPAKRTVRQFPSMKASNEV